MVPGSVRRHGSEITSRCWWCRYARLAVVPWPPPVFKNPRLPLAVEFRVRAPYATGPGESHCPERYVGIAHIG